jgi:hypothetical protein
MTDGIVVTANWGAGSGIVAVSSVLDDERVIGLLVPC